MIEKYASNNYNERSDGQNPSLIVLHYTGMRSAKEALEHLCNPDAEVSAHYVIEEDGAIHHLVPDDKRAWHAGKSYWRGEVDINSASIGIEIVNPGHEFGYKAFSEKQIIAVSKLCKQLMEEYGISAAGVLGHSDVAITRKIDPGHLFPWQVLADKGVGLWPQVLDMDYQASEDLIANPENLHRLLADFGYDPSRELGEIVRAFHRRFAPGRFADCNSEPDEPDVATCAKLLALIRQSNELS